MVAKLEVVEPHLVTIETDGDPFELLQHQGRDADAAVVLGDVDGGQLVLHNGHQGRDQHKLGDIAVHQKASYQGYCVLMQQV